MFRQLVDTDAAVLTIYIDGEAVAARAGETVAGVMVRQKSPVTRTTPVHGTPRAPYCMMGVCFECMAIVDGMASTQTCMLQVQEGMKVERQHGRRSVA